MSLTPTEYEKALEAVAFLRGETAADVESVLNRAGASGDAELLNDIIKHNSFGDAEGRMIFNQRGEILYQAGDYSHYSASAVDSNVVTKTKVTMPTTTTRATAPSTSITAKVGVREAGSFVLGEVAPAVLAAGIGISLGKTIDSALYSANPDFFDEHGMSSINPDTWSSITSGDSSLGASLFNLVLGIDGDATQAYVDEDAYAYLAYWLAQQGFFSDGTVEDVDIVKDVSVPTSLITGTLGDMAAKYFGKPLFDPSGADYPGVLGYREGVGLTILANPEPLNVSTRVVINDDFTTTPTIQRRTGYGVSGNYVMSLTAGTYNKVGNRTTNPGDIYMLWSQFVPSVEGVGTQDGATTPDTSTWTDPASTKTSLQTQYPDTWNNAKHYDYVDDDGTQKSRTLIPVNLPNTSNPKDKQPTSGNETQQKTDVDPESSTDTLLDLVLRLINETPTPTPNPSDTGSGNSPVVATPSGSASSLWAVYNPTQAEVDSFGAWLWSSNLVEQIKKLFNNPMEAIIGIHKIYATPSTGSAVTIKCGYIDSGVSALAVTDQYTTIDCGTVSLNEYFGNIFDYAPYTKVDLYLPFIGIVSLDVADVMRSSISVKYTVDVFTGACLAEVKVSRDGFDPTMYTYSGSCAVTYPLSSGTYVSALAGVASIAAGVVGTIASGGALAPALIGGAVGATSLHSDVQKSGGFSGSAGAMGAKTPYLIISRPQTAMADDVEDYKGLPANKTVKLGDCSGYVRVDSCHLEGIIATETEILQIENLLKQGVIL